MSSESSYVDEVDNGNERVLKDKLEAQKGSDVHMEQRGVRQKQLLITQIELEGLKEKSRIIEDQNNIINKFFKNSRR